MRHITFSLIFGVAFFYSSQSIPVDKKDVVKNSDAKSAFGTAFDEIVVESHLTVRGKTNRQSRSKNITQNIQTIKTKREIKLPFGDLQRNRIQHQKKQPRQRPFEASASSAQAQSFLQKGPLGNFGASASSSISQNFGIRSKGPVATAGFSGTQQYVFNDRVIDIAFGDAFGRAGGAAIRVSGNTRTL